MKETKKKKLERATELYFIFVHSLISDEQFMKEVEEEYEKEKKG